MACGIALLNSLKGKMHEVYVFLKFLLTLLNCFATMSFQLTIRLPIILTKNVTKIEKKNNQFCHIFINMPGIRSEKLGVSFHSFIQKTHCSVYSSYTSELPRIRLSYESTIKIQIT